MVGDEGHLRPSRRIQASRVVCAGRAAAGGVRGRSDLSRHRRLARRRGQVVHERVPEAEVAHGARGGAAADLRYAPLSEPDHQQHLTATVGSTWMSLMPRRERGAVGVAHALPQVRKLRRRGRCCVPLRGLPCKTCVLRRAARTGNPSRPTWSSCSFWWTSTASSGGFASKPA